MRRVRPFAAVVVALALTTVPRDHAGAQGVLIPRCGTEPCRIPQCATDAVCPRPIPAWGAQIVRSSSRVRATLADGVLHYEVDETFVNRGGRLGEADYIFPLPRNASFAGLALSIDGQLVSGETMDAGRARGIYEEIVQRQRDPALVEWMGYGMLRARIFPIQPGEAKRVVVRFDQVAEREGDALRVQYVRGSAPEGGPLVRPVSYPEDRAASSTFTLTYPASAGYGRPYSPTHALDASIEHGMEHVEVTGSAPEITVLIPVPRHGAEPAVNLLANRAADDDGFALITLAPPAIAHAPVPRDIAFVLDVSGSMSGRKIEQARAAGEQLLSTLTPRDRFRLIDFSSDVRSFRDGFVAATPDNLRAARQYLESLTAEGGTNIAGALESALNGMASSSSTERLPLVLFITDGEPTVGEQRPEAIAAEAARLRGRARVFTFGLGADVNAALLESLALQGHGTAQFVRPTEDAERAVSLVASRLTSPVATDVRVSADGVRLTRIVPNEPIDIFAGQDVVVLARYTGSGRATLRFDGNTPIGPVHWTRRVDFPDRERANAFVPRLWATRRVGFLSAERRRNGPNPEIDSEIRALGERFGIPTELTSYLVQEPPRTALMMRGTANLSAVPATAPATGQLRLGQVVVTGMATKPASRDQAFEAARRATQQRAAATVAAVDSLSLADAPGRVARRIGNRVFSLVDSVWTDARLSDPSAGTPRRTIRVRPFSDAYFAVLAAIPDLEPVFALGDRVRVRGRDDVALELAPEGATALSAGDLDVLRTAF